MGETMSAATIDELTQKRVIGGKCTREEIQPGRKIDWIFKQDETALGCGEAAKNRDHTKTLLDGGFKMPKVMKSMFATLSESAPEYVRDLTVPGFLVTQMSVVEKVMDAPSGYVCRVNSLPARPFPSSEKEVIPLLIPILRQILKAKMSMESTYKLVRSAVNDSDEFVGVQYKVQ